MNNKLTIKGGFKNGRSYLKDTFFTPPFRVVDVSEHRHDPTAYVTVMSSSPGMLDGDHYEINIEVDNGCSLRLQSQSYQRIFNMERGATQHQQVKLHSGATFTYIQHPVVPHEKAIFKGRNRIEMADDCRLIFGEILTCGRKHSGEVFRYTSFHNITEVYHNDKLLVKDNLLLQPQTLDMAAIGQMEGYTHQATLIHVNTGINAIEEMVDELYIMLEGEEDVALGISCSATGILILRMLGNGGEQLFNALQRVADYCGNYKLQETIS